MPTIAEILASKKAAAASAAVPPAANVPLPITLAQRAAQKQEEADDRDLLTRLTPPPLGKSLVLSKELPAAFPNGEPRGQMTPITGPRALGATEGETLDLTPLHADECIKDWHKAATAFSTELCIMRDPVDTERAWLAVRLEEDPRHPLLLKDLPIYEHPMTVRPVSEPF